MDMRLLISILLICFLIGSCKHSKDNIIESKTPNTEIALQFINDYVYSLGDIDIQSNNLLTENFKKEYYKIINAAFEKDPEYGLGFDPIVDGQDYPDKFELESIDTLSNYLIVKGVEWSNFRVTMKLTYKNGKWLVDGSGIVNIPNEKQIPR
jgi:hypothetical protein